MTYSQKLIVEEIKFALSVLLGVAIVVTAFVGWVIIPSLPIANEPPPLIAFGCPGKGAHEIAYGYEEDDFPLGCHTIVERNKLEIDYENDH